MRKGFIVPIIIAVVALAIRLYGVGDGIIFGYDQARDAYRVTDFIKNGNLMLLGPETDIPGVHHGVGFYYLLVLPYAISQSPVVATVFFVVLHSAFVLFLYASIIEVFHSKTIAVITALLFAVSFEMVQYSRWLSNPTLGALALYALWFCLVRYTRGHANSLVHAFFLAGIAIHFQLFLLYAGLFVFVLPFFFKKQFRWGMYLKGVCVYFFFLIPFVLAEIKFNGQLVESFSQFFANSRVYHGPLEILSKIVFRMESVITHVLAPEFPALALPIFFGSLVYSLFHLTTQKISTEVKSALRLLLIWHFFSYSVYIFSSGAVGTEFSFVGGVVSIIVIVGFVIGDLLVKPKFYTFMLGLSSILVLIHIHKSITSAYLGSYLFSVQQQLTYGLEKDIVDYVYAGSDQSEKFSICTLTNPFYVNTMWAYVFSTYGLQTYGFVPYWAGSNQEAYLGGKDLPVDTKKPSLRYLIYEPRWGMPDYMPGFFRSIEDHVSDIAETKHFGEFIVEKRTLKPDDLLAKNQSRSEYQGQLEEGKLFSCYN